MERKKEILLRRGRSHCSLDSLRKKKKKDHLISWFLRGANILNPFKSSKLARGGGGGGNSSKRWTRSEQRDRCPLVKGSSLRFFSFSPLLFLIFIPRDKLTDIMKYSRRFPPLFVHFLDTYLRGNQYPPIFPMPWDFSYFSRDRSLQRWGERKALSAF